MDKNLNRPGAVVYGSVEAGESRQEAGNDVDSAEHSRFVTVFGGFQILLVVLFACFVRYGNANIFVQSGEQVQYIFYLDVTIMMLVGFGYLMTFMRKYGLGAVGYTFLITAMCIPWATLTGRFFFNLAGSNPDGSYPDYNPATPTIIHVDTNALLQGNFAAATVLISFGAVIGKVSPTQLVLMSIFECIAYSFNKEVVNLQHIGVLDMGGTIFIHLFGAYFGLSISYVLGKPRSGATEAAEASVVSDVFSLIGTTFLWIFWPSFNGATAGFHGTNTQLYTTANTVLALSASCMWTFIFSRLFNNGRISVVDIQNSTLAGGVAIGASSNMPIQPYMALLVGLGSALVSTVGFNFIQSKLENVGLHDSCGVHNLHGMPAVYGTCVVALAAYACGYGVDQAIKQLLGGLATFFCAILTGTLTGFILKLFPSPGSYFKDKTFWKSGTAPHED